MFDLDAAKTGWLDDFERFASRKPTTDPSETNVVVVAKAVPGIEVPANTPAADTVEPKDIPKAGIASTTPAANDDALLKTGSIKSQRPPLLPPVPTAESFKVHKGDRLGASPRLDPAHTAPNAPEGTPDANSAAPHAELAPTKANAAMLPNGKSAMLSPGRSDRLPPMVVASAAMKPMDLAPEHPDPLFQGPPIPADPTIDPDAPVLGYAEQMSSAEAPFKALFAVTPVAKHSWLGVDTTAPAKAKSSKPSKIAHILRHRRTDG